LCWSELPYRKFRYIAIAAVLLAVFFVRRRMVLNVPRTWRFFLLQTSYEKIYIAFNEPYARSFTYWLAYWRKKMHKRALSELRTFSSFVELHIMLLLVGFRLAEVLKLCWWYHLIQVRRFWLNCLFFSFPIYILAPREGEWEIRTSDSRFMMGWSPANWVELPLCMQRLGFHFLFRHV